jgi:hypothetical protein
MQEPSDRDRVRGPSELPDDEPVDEGRYVAGGPPDREVGGEEYAGRASERETGPTVRREAVRDTGIPEGREYRGVRYGSTDPYGVLEIKDLVRWGPIVAGFATSIAILIMMAVLGGAIGLTASNQGAGAQQNSGTFGIVWAAASLIIAFFAGGWLASRTAGPGGRMSALVNSGLVWAFALMFALVVAGLGVASLSGTITAITGLTVRALQVQVPAEQTIAATWGTLGALVIGLASALAGGLVGQHTESEPVSR